MIMCHSIFNQNNKYLDCILKGFHQIQYARTGMMFLQDSIYYSAVTRTWTKSCDCLEKHVLLIACVIQSILSFFGKAWAYD